MQLAAATVITASSATTTATQRARGGAALFCASHGLRATNDAMTPAKDTPPS